MSKKQDKKIEEKESPRKIALRFSQELIQLKDTLKISKDTNSFDQTKNEIQIKVLDIAKRMVREILSIPPSYTYEEIEAFLDKTESLNDEGKTHGRIISSLLNDTEFSPEPEYERLNSIIEGMISFADWSANYVPGKDSNKKRVPNKFLAGLWNLLKGATFIFWFPFYWFFSSAKRFSEKSKITDDPAYPLRKELKKAFKHYSRKDMKKAIESYEKVRELYSKSPAEIKALVRPEILRLHEQIMSDYKNISNKH